jgi:type I restriction enzyme, R subunit
MNQNPEQLARDRIDDLLVASGWIIQDRRSFNLAAGPGVAIREYATDGGPTNCALFVHSRAVKGIEAKHKEEGERLTMHEVHLEDCITATAFYFNDVHLQIKM